MKMTLSNGTELQLTLAPGATVKITKTEDGEKLELDGVELISGPTWAEPRDTWQRCMSVRPADPGYGCELSEGHSGPHKALLWEPAPITWTDPDPRYGWTEAEENDYHLLVNGEEEGSSGWWNAYKSTRWNAMGAGAFLDLPANATEAQAKAAVIAAWEAAHGE